MRRQECPEHAMRPGPPPLPPFCSYCGERMLFRFDWQQGKHKADCPTQARPSGVSAQAIEKLAAKLKIRTWNQGDDGFGGEWEIDPEHYRAMQEFWDVAFQARAKREK